MRLEADWMPFEKMVPKDLLRSEVDAGPADQGRTQGKSGAVVPRLPGTGSAEPFGLSFQRRVIRSTMGFPPASFGLLTHCCPVKLSDP